MSKSGTLDLVSGVGGKIQKEEVLLAVNKYEKYHDGHGGADEEKKANYTDMVNKYYDLVTSFYEYGWGEYFHFAPRWKGESFRESIKRHEHFLAMQLGLKAGQKVLDVGCVIGGPLREIARFSDTFVTGINNNEYQITRAMELNRAAGVDKTCNYVKADYMKMPFPDDNCDAIFAIEATCHAPDVLDCYREIYRVLKPGYCFAAYEWCITDSFDPMNDEHKRIKDEVELGNGLPDIRSMGQYLEALKLAGFEANIHISPFLSFKDGFLSFKVILEKDIAVDSPLPWYLPLDNTVISLSNFRTTSIGRFFTRNMVKALVAIRIAPEGSQRVQAFLEKTADALVEGGREWESSHQS